MTELLRPSLYGALHPITIFPRDDSRLSSEDNYVVVGHCCESGDLFTPAPGEPEVRELFTPPPKRKPLFLSVDKLLLAVHAFALSSH